MKRDTEKVSFYKMALMLLPLRCAVGKQNLFDGAYGGGRGGRPLLLKRYRIRIGTQYRKSVATMGV